MKTTLKIATLLLAALALTAVVGCETDSGKTKTITSSEGGGDGATVEEVAEPTSSTPEGSYKLASCELDLGGSINSYKLIGSVRVQNTGDVPINAVVSYKWLLGDGGEVKAADQKVSNLAGGKRKLIFFSEKVSQDVGGSFQDHPGYFNSKNCKANAKITG